MLNNQSKITSIINQAQKNGWMSNAKLIEIKEAQSLSGEIYVAVFDVLYLARFQSSLSDIIFDKDFAEKFFPEYCQVCGRTKTIDHQILMLPMDNQERIDFLYKHVEEKEELNFRWHEFNPITGETKRLVLKDKPKCEPIEEMKNGEIEFLSNMGINVFSITTLVNKINELIKHHNERCHDTK